MTQGSWPRNHLPEKLVMGVRGAAVRHIIMSDRAMLHTNRLIPGSTVQHSRRNFYATRYVAMHIKTMLWSVYKLYKI